jgi:hypothetical protein|tara:strand:- start:11478 stop:11756 length:279 start_codon:yes stop_codon:yes gene_type:complete
MTDLSSEDNTEMAEVVQDLLQAKMDVATADGQMTHVLRIGTFHMEIVPDKRVDIDKLFRETIDNLFDRFGEGALKISVSPNKPTPPDARHYG